MRFSYFAPSRATHCLGISNFSLYDVFSFSNDHTPPCPHRGSPKCPSPLKMFFENELSPPIPVQMANFQNTPCSTHKFVATAKQSHDQRTGSWFALKLAYTVLTASPNYRCGWLISNFNGGSQIVLYNREHTWRSPMFPVTKVRWWGIHF